MMSSLDNVRLCSNLLMRANSASVLGSARARSLTRSRLQANVEALIRTTSFAVRPTIECCSSKEAGAYVSYAIEDSPIEWG